MPFEAVALARRVVAPGRCPVPVIEMYMAGEAVFSAGEAAFPVWLLRGPPGPLMPSEASVLGP